MKARSLNILLIFTDQHQQRILGAYGNEVVKTPRVDALAAEGVLFHNAIVAQPVCTPSRASLLTGTYGHTHGCIKNNWELTTEIPTAAEILKEHGYRCGYIGKWHCGNELVPQRGFENFYIHHPWNSFATKEFQPVINNVDVLPTLLDMVGLPIPEHIQGHSFRRALEGEEGLSPRFGVVEWNGVLQNMHSRDPCFRDVLDAHVRCIVTPRWKLVLSPGDRSELYDLEKDPLEQCNIFGRGENREVVSELYEHLLKWQEETDDPLNVPHSIKEA